MNASPIFPIEGNEARMVDLRQQIDAVVHPAVPLWKEAESASGRTLTGESAAQLLWQGDAHCSSVRFAKSRIEMRKEGASDDKNPLIGQSLHHSCV